MRKIKSKEEFGKLESYDSLKKLRFTENIKLTEISDFQFSIQSSKMKSSVSSLNSKKKQLTKKFRNKKRSDRKITRLYRDKV